MPRLEITPDNWAESDEARRGDGAPTVDVCKPCRFDYFPAIGEEIEQRVVDRLLICARGTSAWLTSDDVEHPCYSTWDCVCAHCGQSMSIRE